MRLFLISLLFITYFLNADELSWVDEQVKAIKPPRPGINNIVINSITDPFVFLKKNGAKRTKQIKKKKIIHKTAKVKTVKRPIKKRGSRLTLEMIINSSALIDGNWYKAGENIRGYTINKVKKRSVIVTFNGKKSNLYIKSTKSNLNFKTK